ncbi:MAG: hypothetical protein ABIH11_05420 [Candidatus Altiarchaeota archaeon]
MSLEKAYYIIDRVPEFPYFLFASYYVFTTPVSTSRHVFSIAFIYMLVSLLLGLGIKHILKTERPRPYGDVKPFCFDIPSIHTSLSLGAVAFTYFVNPVYSILMFPVGVLYFYSRLKLGYHTKKAILVGALIGVVTGIGCGMLLADLYFTERVESYLSVLFFSIPPIASVLRAWRASR